MRVGFGSPYLPRDTSLAWFPWSCGSQLRGFAEAERLVPGAQFDPVLLLGSRCVALLPATYQICDDVQVMPW